MDQEHLLTPGEVAALFRVDPKTVTRWATAGRISSIRTPGGHRRFRQTEVAALLSGQPATRAVPVMAAPAPASTFPDTPRPTAALPGLVPEQAGSSMDASGSTALAGGSPVPA